MVIVFLWEHGGANTILPGNSGEHSTFLVSNANQEASLKEHRSVYTYHLQRYYRQTIIQSSFFYFSEHITSQLSDTIMQTREGNRVGQRRGSGEKVTRPATYSKRRLSNDKGASQLETSPSDDRSQKRRKGHARGSQSEPQGDKVLELGELVNQSRLDRMNGRNSRHAGGIGSRDIKTLQSKERAPRGRTKDDLSTAKENFGHDKRPENPPQRQVSSRKSVDEQGRENLRKSNDDEEDSDEEKEEFHLSDDENPGSTSDDEDYNSPQKSIPQTNRHDSAMQDDIDNDYDDEDEIQKEYRDDDRSAATKDRETILEYKSRRDQEPKDQEDSADGFDERISNTPTQTPKKPESIVANRNSSANESPHQVRTPLRNRLRRSRNSAATSSSQLKNDAILKPNKSGGLGDSGSTPNTSSRIRLLLVVSS